MNYNILLSCVGLILISIHSSVLSSMQDQELALDLDRTLTDCMNEEVDPRDMGSYSHTTKCNDAGHKKRQQQNVEETVVKQAVYREGHGRSDHSPSQIHTDQPMNIMTSVSSIGTEVNSGFVDVVGVGDGRQFVQYTETTTKYRKGECVCPTMDQTPVMIYMRQMVGSLLDQMGVRHHNFGPGETITIDLQGEISYESFMDLTTFLSSTDGENQKQLQSVSEIVSNLLHTVHNPQPMGSMGFMAEKILFHLPMLTTPKFWLTLFSLTVIGFTTVVLCCLMLRASDSPARLLFYGALLFFVFSCVWIYAEKHENSKAENAARLEQFDSIPRDCQYNNFTEWERVKYFFRVNVAGYDDECAQYYRETSIDPFYRNTPVEAISEAAARFVFHPLEYIGDKCGTFLNSITRAVPFWMRPFVLIMLFMTIFFALFPYRIRTPLLSIEPASRPQLPPALPQQEQIAGPIVPLRRLDAATDTDDLEEFILRQQMGRERENYEAEENQIPRLLPTSSSWRRLSDSALGYIRTFSNLVLRVLTMLLRDTPQLNAEDQQFPEEEEIWEEHHQNRMELMPEQEPVQVPMSIPQPVEVPIPGEAQMQMPLPRPLEVAMPAPVEMRIPGMPFPKCAMDSGIEAFGAIGAFGLVGGDSGLEEGFVLDFDESTLGDDDELLEGDILMSPCTETTAIGLRPQLGFNGIFGFGTNENYPYYRTPPSSSASHHTLPRHLHHRNGKDS